MLNDKFQQIASSDSIEVYTAVMTRVLVTGSRGFLGSSFVRELELVGFEVIRHTRQDANLLDCMETLDFLEKSLPDLIIHCAAVVGGIKANIDGGSRFYLQNMEIDFNVLSAAHKLEVENLIYFGSSCMYPANRFEPLKIEDLMTGPLEPTNYNYALAKIVGSHTTSSIAEASGRNWRTVITSNLYGPRDCFDREKSHLLASIIRKAVEASELQLSSISMWGDGKARREFTFAPDLVNWIVSQLNNLSALPLVMNVGYGEDYSIREYYEMVLEVLSLDIQIKSDPSMPSGNLRKLMDSSIAKGYGWNPATSLREGIKETINWYRNGGQVE